MSAGTLYPVAMTSLESIGLFIAGWASNNKYARIGALRTLLQFIAYEIPLLLSILSVLIVSQTLDLSLIAAQQGPHTPPGIVIPAYFLGIPYMPVDSWGGILTWHIIKMPPLGLAYVIFFVASLVACHRAPFDLPEAESELIGGPHTEYSGLRFAWLMLAEYSMLFLMSLLGVILFLGAGHTPFPNFPGLPLGLWTSGFPGTWLSQVWSSFWLFVKVWFVIFLKMMIRWTFPRMRFDQVIHLCWQYLIPVALLLCLVTLCWQLLILWQYLGI